MLAYFILCGLIGAALAIAGFYAMIFTFGWWLTLGMYALGFVPYLYYRFHGWKSC